MTKAQFLLYAFSVFTLSGCITPNKKGPPGSFLDIEGKSHCYYNKEACRLAGGDDLYNATVKIAAEQEERRVREQREAQEYLAAQKQHKEEAKMRLEKEQQEKEREQEKERAWASLTKQEIEDLARKNHVVPFRVITDSKYPVFQGVFLDSINKFQSIYGREMIAAVVVTSPEPDRVIEDPKFAALSGLKVTAKKGMYMAVDCQNGWAETSMKSYGPIQKYDLWTRGLTDEYRLAEIICSYR